MIWNLGLLILTLIFLFIDYNKDPNLNTHPPTTHFVIILGHHLKYLEIFQEKMCNIEK
jgi:hypothetical protein